ncbi:MAG: DUF4352 domain-containing protein [Terracidiphilus sp.]
MRSFLKLVVIVIIAIFILLVFHSMTRNSSENQLSSASEQTQRPVFSVTSGNLTYHGAVSSDVGVAILGVNSGPYMMGFGNAVRADGKFINIAVAIRNGQNTAITMNTSLFEIVDSYGNVYSASEKSMEVEPESDLFLAQINPGVTKTGRILFDVPASLSMDNLRLRFRGGMTGDTGTVALKVNSTLMEAPAPPETTTPQAENASAPIQPIPGNPAADTQKRENEDFGAPPTQTETQQTTQVTSPHSGVLHYAGSPVPFGGVIVFDNLPAERLEFNFDHSMWSPTIKVNPDGTKKLTLTSLKQGYQTSCDVGWEIAE